MSSTKKRKKPGPKPVLEIDSGELRRRMLAEGLSPAELARQSGLNVTRIYQLQTGKKPGITIPTARRLAGVLGCRFQDITQVVEKAS